MSKNYIRIHYQDDVIEVYSINFTEILVWSACFIFIVALFIIAWKYIDYLKKCAKQDHEYCMELYKMTLAIPLLAIQRLK